MIPWFEIFPFWLQSLSMFIGLIWIHIILIGVSWAIVTGVSDLVQKKIRRR